MINLTEIPEQFGNLFNVGSDVGGVMISVIVLLAVIVAVSLAKDSLVAISLSGIGVISFFTFLGWFPIWLTIIIALALVVMFGRDAINGSGVD